MVASQLRYACATRIRLVTHTRTTVRTNNIDEELQQTLVRAMMEPEFYPKPPPAVTHQETHISHLFFAGDLVYKIKKPVRYSFLDFSSLVKRRHFLNEELRLNRRLAPSVYLAVVPIVRNVSGWRLSAEGDAAEYALVMPMIFSRLGSASARKKPRSSTAFPSWAA